MANCCPRPPTKMERQTSKYQDSQQTPIRGKLHGNQSQYRKISTVIKEVLEAQCGQISKLKTPGGPNHKGEHF